MRLLAPVQFAFIKSNRYWPFSVLNKLPYFLAIKAFTRLCTRAPQIHSAYLRHSIAEDRWEAGLSDIDLTVIMTPGMTREAEFTFLGKLHRAFGRLTKFYPMLGQMEVLPLDYLESWCLYSMRGRSVRKWIRLCGEDFRAAPDFPGVQDTGFDRLSYALYVYLDSFMNRLLQPKWGPRLEPEFLRRLLCKVEHYAGSAGQKIEGLSFDRSSASMQLQIVQCLEHSSTFQTTRTASDTIDGHPARPSLEALPLLREEAVRRSLVSLIEGHDGYFAILNLGAQTSLLLRCINRLYDQLLRKSNKLFILGPRCFQFHVCQNAPFLHSTLSDYRVVHFGKDLIPDIPVPSTEAFALTIISQFSMALAAFPHGLQMTKTLEEGQAGHERVLSILKRILYIQLYCDTGCLPPSHKQLRNECRDRYPRPFEELRRLFEKNPVDKRLRLYELLKENLDNVNGCLIARHKNEGTLCSGTLQIQGDSI